jgi:hypothetical protein
MSPFFDDLETQLQHAARRELADLAPPGTSPAWWRRPRALALFAVGAAGLATPAIARVSGIWAPDASPRPHARTTATGLSCIQPGQPPTAPGSVTTAPASPELTRILSVLRRPATGQDRIPVHGLPVTLMSVVGVNPAAIRFVGSAGGHRFFVVPNLGPRPRPALPEHCLERMTPAERHAYTAAPRTTGQPQLCVVEATGGGGCGATASDVRSRGVQLSLALGNGDSTVVGLVPDGVTAVTLSYGSSQRTFAVHDNFFSYVIALAPGQSPTSTVWHLTDGATRQIP